MYFVRISINTMTTTFDSNFLFLPSFQTAWIVDTHNHTVIGFPKKKKNRFLKISHFLRKIFFHEIFALHKNIFAKFSRNFRIFAKFHFNFAKKCEITRKSFPRFVRWKPYTETKKSRQLTVSLNC